MNPDFEKLSGLSFDEQWRRAWTIEIPTGQSEIGLDGLPLYPEGRPEIMKVYDIIPPVLTHRIPVMFIPGWTGTAEGFRRHIFGLARLGYRALGVTAVHGITPTEDMPEFPFAEVRKKSSTLWAMDAKELGQVDLVVHSEASLFTIMTARAHRERVRNIIMDSPAGLIGPDNWKRLLAGFTKDAYEQMVEDMRDPARRQFIRESYTCIQQAFNSWDNGRISIAEVQAILAMQIGQHLRELKRRGHGIIIIVRKDDRQFPLRLVQKIARPDMYDELIIANGHHREMFRQPERYVETLNEQLIRLEAKHP